VGNRQLRENFRCLPHYLFDRHMPKLSELIEPRIYEVRGHKVIIDSDLAKIYEVTTGNLNRTVRRNPERFPSDFMFRLTKEETNSLLLRGRHTPPNAFTELGVAMLSSVLKSARAVQMSVQIMHTFESGDSETGAQQEPAYRCHHRRILT
jgi:hypothetical protein